MIRQKKQVVMTTQPVTLHLPDKIYERIQQTARLLQRPVETLLLEAVTTALPLLDDLPPELVDDVVALALLNDAALWQKARSTLPQSSQERLDLLLDEKNQGTLTTAGQQELDQWLKVYEHVVLIRAQAAILLQQRGYDISDYAPCSTALGDSGLAST
jgi:hypothetical protein